jgi:Glycosyl transferase family 2
MIIEAIVVCVNYSDFLEHTLPANMQQVDHLLVVTHPDDKRTQQLCTKFGIDFVDTEVFHENGDKFNKARAIRLGMSHLRNNGWLLHMDADILLPHGFRSRLVQAKLNEKNIYGADRLNTRSFEHWEKHKEKTIPQHQWRYLVKPPSEFPLGSRLLHNEYGYCPIGYFQLWHSSAHRQYPINSGSAEHSDVLFAVQWPRERRILLPEFFVYHLESDGNARMGANWKGRTTPVFGNPMKLRTESDYHGKGTA